MKKIKNSYYTLYKGIECRIGTVRGHHEIVYDGHDCPFEDFIYYDENIYYKQIDISEIGDVYRVYTYAIYHGHDIAIESSTDNAVLLVSSNKMFYEQYGFEEVDRNVYMKDVSFDDVELVEERRLARYIESAKTFV